MDYLTIMEGKYDPSIHGVFEGDFEREHFKSKNVWDDFQIFSFQAIKRGDNLLVVAPTSSGKTSVAKYAILYHLLNSNKTVVYTTPTKSLSNEKYEEMIELLEPYGISPGLLTGDHKINVDSRFIIMTAEILSNALFMLKNNKTQTQSLESSKSAEQIKHYELDRSFVERIGCVVMDEIHFISDQSRGHIWENTLILLDSLVQIIGLSATIDTPEIFASWLGRIKKRLITLVKKYDRPVPLEYSIYDTQDLKTILDSTGKYCGENFTSSLKKIKEDDVRHETNHTDKVNARLNSFINYAKEKELLQLCFIVFSKKNCELYAKNVSVELMNGKESVNAVNILDKKMGIYLKTYKTMPRYQQVRALIEKGVCFHHAGLPVIIKEVIEKMFKEGHIKVLFATETVAIGVNMPIRTLVLTSVEKNMGIRVLPLNAAEFKQICGRAGRRGLDSKGLVVFLPFYEPPSEHYTKTALLFGPMPKIESRMEITYHSYLKLLQSDVITHNDFFDNSLLSVQNSNIINSINSQIKEYEEQIKFSQVIIDSYIKMNNIKTEILKDLTEHIRLSSISSGTMSIGGISVQVKQSKQQQRNQKRLEDVVKNNRKIYDMLLDQHKIKSLSEKEKEHRQTYITYKDDRFSTICEYLNRSGYVNININDNTTSVTLTEYGKMVTCINECNPFILAKVFTGNILNNLTPKEIVCFLSIFTDRKNKNDKPTLNSIKIDSKIKKYIEYMEQRIVNYIDLEQKMRLTSEDDYWELSYDYLEITALWMEIDLESEDHSRILQALTDMDEYEGSFVKNMLKINNIVSNLIILCNATQQLDVLPILQEIERLILRGMVNADSLHVSS